MTTTNTTAFSVSTDDIISGAMRRLGRLGAGATAISSITVPPNNSSLVIMAGTGGITLNNGTLVLKGGVNATVPQFSTISFISDGANLFEIGRGF